MQNTIFILSSVFLNCAAQLSMKKGMLDFGKINEVGSLIYALPLLFLNAYLWISLFCYMFSFILWMVVLSRVEVSYAYPFLSIGYVLSTVGGYYLFNENISPVRIVGVVVICIGVALVAQS